MKKDIILITGPSACGKTYTRELLSKQLGEKHIEPRYLSTASYIIKAVQKDDTKGGRNHIHPWTGISHGHTHTAGQPILPFATIDDVLNDQVYQQFFADCSKLPENENTVILLELTCGVNINKVKPYTNPDRSYKKLVHNLHSSIWSHEWLKRIHTVIHPEADYFLRKKRNTTRSNSANTQYWALMEYSFDYYGDDDFSYFKAYCNEKYGASILNIENNDPEAYTNKIRELPLPV